jgi:hypothetical protein
MKAGKVRMLNGSSYFDGICPPIKNTQSISTSDLFSKNLFFRHVQTFANDDASFPFDYDFSGNPDIGIRNEAGGI